MYYGGGNMLKVIPRNKSFMKGYKEYRQEFYDNHIVTFVPTNPERIDETWYDRTAAWYARKELESFGGYARGVHYWAIDDDNIASIRVCENNGGVLMDKVMLESIEEGKRLVRRYWIFL